MRAQTKKYNQLAVDMKRWKELNKKFFPNGEMFVEQTEDPEWSEFNVLCIKLSPVIEMISKS